MQSVHGFNLSGAATPIAIPGYGVAGREGDGGMVGSVLRIFFRELGPRNSGAETHKIRFLHPTPRDGNNTRGLYAQCLPEEL